MDAPKKVFISYSHDSQAHKLWVLQLATRLRSCGVDAAIDQWDLGPGGDLPHFMEQNIANSDRVVMVCTERYVQKANDGAGGVGYEKMIVTADLLKTISSNKVIPIVRQSGACKLPTFIASKLYIDLSKDDEFETGFDQLLRELIDAPLFKKPPLGSAPNLISTPEAKTTSPSPVTQLMLALQKAYEKSSHSGSIEAYAVRQAMPASKLYFDHACDLASKEALISFDPITGYIRVTAKGRQEMIKLISEK